MDAYLRLMASLFNTLPINALDPPAPGSKPQTNWNPGDSDDDDDHPIRITVVSQNSLTEPLPEIDARTRKRLATLPDPPHVSALFNACTKERTRLGLVVYLLALGTVWPARRDKLLSSVLVYAGGGLVRELYRSYVRPSHLGKDDEYSTLIGSYFGIVQPRFY
jgi:ubiquitin-protein ligase E3 C